MGLEVETAVVAGRRIRYRAAGEGRPLVLVHGLAGSWRWWRGNVERLADGRRIVLVDLAELAPRRRLALVEAPAALRAFLEAAGIGPADVVGHSLGGLVALRLAAGWPEAVRRLVLVAPAALLERRALPGHGAALALALRRARPSFLALLAADALRAGPLPLLRATRDLLADDVRPHLAAVRAPTLLVWGERDTLVPPSLAELLRAELPDARVAVLEGAGHVPMVERPRAFEDAVLAFLADESVPAPGTVPGTGTGQVRGQSERLP